MIEKLKHIGYRVAPVLGLALVLCLGVWASDYGVFVAVAVLVACLLVMIIASISDLLLPTKR